METITLPLLDQFHETDTHSFRRLFYSSEEGTYNMVATSVILTSGDTIPEEMFAFCDTLQSIQLPNSVARIGNSAFHKCTSLRSIDLPSELEAIGDYAFFDCSTLTDLDIPDSVTLIGELAFSKCSSLITISLPAGTNSVSRGAFEQCRLLETVYIPDSVTVIEEWAFNFCESLETIKLPSELTTVETKAFANCTSLVTLDLPDKLTTVGDYAFSDCTQISTMTIPASLTSIGIRVFPSSMAEIRVENGNTVYTVVDNCLVEIATKTLVMGLSTGKIPAGGVVETIGKYAFAGVSGLTHLQIPDGVMTIDEYAFAGCSGIETLELSGTVEVISAHAFDNCTAIKNLVIPAAVQAIYSYAFAGCSGLETIEVDPENTKYFAVNNCLIHLYQPDGDSSVILYELVLGCKDSMIPAHIFEICDGAFYGCSDLTDLDFSGTMAQWNALQKGANWDAGTGDYIVHCSDGDIHKI